MEGMNMFTIISPRKAGAPKAKPKPTPAPQQQQPPTQQS